MARAFYPLPFQKEAMEAEMPFHRRCRSRQIFGIAKDFCPNFPKLARKVFCAILPTIFSHKDHEDLFLV